MDVSEAASAARGGYGPGQFLAVQCRRVRLIGWISLVVLGLATARALDPLPAGLTATHFSDTNWSSRPVHSQIDDRPSTERLFAAWRGSPPGQFSATWRGSLVVFRSGTYTFTTSSDDGSWLYVDGQLVVDNGGAHEARSKSAPIALAAGVHSIFIKYFQDGGALAFDLLWARDGATAAPVPSWALAPRSAGFSRFALSVLVRRATVFAAIAWLAAIVLAGVKIARDDLRDARPSVELGLIAIGVPILLFVLPHAIAGDGLVRYLALAQLIEWHEIPTTPYSMVGPLASAPLYWIGTWWRGSEWWCARFNTIVFLLGLWAAARLLRDRVDGHVRRRFVLLLVACSMFVHHLEGYFGEVFTAVLVTVGLIAIEAGYTGAGWAAAVAGAVNTPAAIAGLAAAAALHTWRTRRVSHLVPVAAAASVILLESWVRRGSPLITGYEGNHGDTTVLTYSGRPGFSYPFVFGVLSILFSFGKGLAFYAPGLWLRVRNPPRFFTLWVAFVAGLIVVYAKWWAWFGGLFWGPRFFLIASVPASFAIATWLANAPHLRLPRRLGLFAVLTLSSWVAIDGAVFGLAGLSACRDVNYEWLCLYVPEFSPLWRPFVEWTRPSWDRVIVGAYLAVVYLWLALPLVRSFARDANEWRRVREVSTRGPVAL